MPARKRELIEPHKGDKRYIRRDERGRIKESDDVTRSLSQDQKRKAKTVAKPGQGDKGDRAPAKKSSAKKSSSSTKSSSKAGSAKKSSAKSPSTKSSSKKSSAKSSSKKK